MLPLRKLIFGLVALLAISTGSASVAQAQTTALSTFNAITNPGGPVVDTAPITQPSTGFQFGFRGPFPGDPGAPGGAVAPGTVPVFQAYDRLLRPNNPANTSTGGARLASTLFAGNNTPAAFTTTNSLANTDTPVAPGPYLILNSSGGVDPSIVRFQNDGTVTSVTFSGFFQGDNPTTQGTFSILRNGLVAVVPTAGALPTTAVVAGQVIVNFSFTVALAAGDTIDFIFQAAPSTTAFTDNLRFNVTAVPEPATMLLLGISGLGVAAAAFRRRRNSEEEGETDATCVS